ncbi:MFS transporter [Streptomyces sp. NPDC097619]|uniref:MFS transporter n=1 Tax=Streptomyces sp. NPDC097619 TaxID=3157228 RepID=UPI0033236A90
MSTSVTPNDGLSGGQVRAESGAELPESGAQASGEGAGKWPTRWWVALLVASGVILLDGLDISMISVATPEIREALGMSASSAQWLVGAYILAFGGFLLLGGRCADLFGQRRVLIIAMSVFAVVSLLGAFADSSTLLVISRFIKGMAAAFTAPAAMSLLTTTFPEGPHRNKAFGIYNVFEAVGFSSGLIVGGLIAAVDWRAIFIMPVPISVLILLAVLKFVPKDLPRAERQRTDIGGGITLVGGMLLLVYTVVAAEHNGWASLSTVLGFVVAALLLVAFVTIERKVKDPLVRLGIFRDRTLVGANLSIGLLYGAAMGFQFVFGVYLQNINGWSPWQMGLTMLPAGLMVVVLGPLLGPLMDRYGVRKVLMTGLLSFLPCYGLLLLMGDEPNLWILLPVSVLWGIGFALSIATLMVAGTNGIADEEQGLASGLLTSSLQVGGAFGLAIVAATIAPGTELDMLYAGVVAMLILSVLALLPQLLRKRG